jgi:hypothetical protein
MTHLFLPFPGGSLPLWGAGALTSSLLLRVLEQPAANVGFAGMAAAAAAAAAAIAAKPAGAISINLGGGTGGGGPLRTNGGQAGAGGSQPAGAQRSVYDFDIEGVEDKPWSKPGASALLPGPARAGGIRLSVCSVYTRDAMPAPVAPALPRRAPS